MVKYFEARGAHCDPAANPAEFLLEVGTGKGTGSVDGSTVDWPAVWKDSKEAKNVREEILKIESDRSHAELKTDHGEDDTEYAAPIWLQTKMLTMRVWRNYWRDASYGYSRMYAFLLNGIFNGFTFWVCLSQSFRKEGANLCRCLATVWQIYRIGCSLSF